MTILEILPNKIPESLKQFDNWVLWRLEERNGKQTKIPYQTNGKTAKTNTSETWYSYEQVLNAYQNGQFSGIGFIVKAKINDEHLIGIDIDYPYESEIAQEVINHFSNTYCEQSPSGKLRIFCTGSKEAIASCKGKNDSKIEVYDEKSPRYLTVTGHHIENTNPNITHCQDGLNWLLEKYFKDHSQIDLETPKNAFKTLSEQDSNNPTPNEKNALWLSNDEIIQKCRQAKNANKFELLFSGSGHKDESAGDLALCSIIAFYSQKEDVIDNIFRQSNRLNAKNGKWNKVHSSTGKTYGQMTIQKAIASLKTTYQSKKQELDSTDERRLSENWYHKLAITINRNGVEQLRSNFYNLLILLENDRKLKGIFRFNELTSKVIVITNPTIPEGELEDGTISSIREYLANAYQYLNSHHATWEATEILNAVLHIAKRQHSYHPIKDYLNSSEWDRTDRINHFLSDHCGTKQSEYTAFIAKSFFLSAVARVFEPGCKVDTMIILEGNQGLGKSSLLRALCKDKEWFRDSAISLESKDAYTALRGKWIIEMSELDSLNKAETTRIKSFMSSQVDSYRPPYGKCDIDVPRQCIFAGTTNKSQYLKDETGNRRFLPIKCEYINLEEIEYNRDMLWAEAITRYQNGEKWYLEKGNPLLRERITEEQESRYEEDAWSNAIAEWLETREQEFTIAIIAINVLNLNLADINRQTEIRIGKILQSLNYEKQRKSINGKRSHFYSPKT